MNIKLLIIIIIIVIILIAIYFLYPMIVGKSWDAIIEEQAIAGEYTKYRVSKHTSLYLQNPTNQVLHSYESKRHYVKPWFGKGGCYYRYHKKEFTIMPNTIQRHEADKSCDMWVWGHKELKKVIG